MNPALISLLVLISIILIIALTTKFRVHAFIALFIVSLLLAAATLPPESIIRTMKEGFGSTMASIGFLIIFGAMIGVILDRTGGTLSIAGYILSKTGEKRSPVALGITGFITGLPIFCDSGFIVLSGLAKSLSRKSAISMPFFERVKRVETGLLGAKLAAPERDVFVIIGNPNTRKSSVVRCLTGCFNRSLRDIETLPGETPASLEAPSAD